MPNDTEAVTPELVGSNIRLVRKRRGLKIADLAQLIGRSSQRVSVIEQGRYPQSLEILNMCAVALKVPTKLFLDPELNTHIEYLIPEQALEQIA